MHASSRDCSIKRVLVAQADAKAIYGALLAFCRWSSFTTAPLEAVAVAVHLEDVHVILKAGQGACQRFVLKTRHKSCIKYKRTSFGCESFA